MTTKIYEPIINTGKQKAFELWMKDYNFDTSIMITFRHKKRPVTIKKQVRAFFKHLNKGEIDFYNKFIYLWVFIERNTYSENTHVHLLVKGLKSENYPLLEQNLRNSFGYAQVKACHENSIPYLAGKYAQDRLLDFDPACKINSRRRKRDDYSIKTTENATSVKEDWVDISV